jgi:hypothetical protein
LRLRVVVIFLALHLFELDDEIIPQPNDAEKKVDKVDKPLDSGGIRL